MNRLILTMTTWFGTSSLLVVDSAIKGTVLVMLAAVAALTLRRDSAATRHLVWLLAIVALLAMPLLSAMLPQWRVLPEWAGIATPPVPWQTLPPSLVTNAEGALERPQNAERAEFDQPPALPNHPAAELRDSRPAASAPPNLPAPAAWNWNWRNALPLIWAIGFCALLLRLLAARCLLRRTERNATVLCSSERPATPRDPIATALEAACQQLNIRRPITLLIHSGKTIPVVWGILRCHLLLPAGARQWSGEQLRSVLLHELVHVKRRDTLAQLLTQIACALHWFNPLVWFAAWRLGVERERACDDLVLACGVRPSAYAGHLLAVVTGHSPARWTQSCGLAMARQSSLESRLVAVLSDKLNRRGVSAVLAAIALAVAVGIAVPIAMLRAADEKAAGQGVQQEPQPSNNSAKLKPGTEQKLQWGEPVNGLRMALAWPPTLDDPAAGEVPDFFLAVQNVSKNSVRLCTTSEAPNERRLTFSTNGVLQGRTVSSQPNGVDVTLQPRETVFLRLFTEGAKDTDRVPHGALMASTVRQSPAMTLLADLEITKAPPGAWTGKLVTPQTRAGVGAESPKNRKAQELFKVWLAHARVNGKIPGGCIAQLGARVQEFVRGNLSDKAGEPYARRMEPLVARLDGARDWQPAEASALLTDIAAVSDSVLSVMLEELAGWTIQYSPTLRKELEDAPWGSALPNGLRVACLFEPRAGAHRLGTSLKMRILIHNVGQEPVLVRSRTWHHIEPTARDAKGAEIEMESVTRYTRPPLVMYRLMPGGFAELSSPGIGVGKRGFHNFGPADIASWVSAQEEDEVTLTPGAVPLSDWNEAGVNGESRWWLDYLTARLKLATPLPTDAAERSELLRRTISNVFYSDPTAEEIAAFVTDREPTALDSLAQRLARRPGLTPFTGSLTSGATTFRVTAADPQGTEPAAKPAASPATADKPKTETTAVNGANAVNEANAVNIEPKDEKSRPLFEQWKASARRDGKIPGGRIGEMAASLKTFMDLNPGHEQSLKLEPLLIKCDAARDWTPAEAAALLDEIAAITPRAEWALRTLTERKIQPGKPLPDNLADAPWGKPAENGLRMAWLLEPRATTHSLGSALKSRVLFHNVGKGPVCFATENWIQLGGHTAKDANDQEIRVWAVERMGIRTRMIYRLAPGEYAEVVGHGLGVGSHETSPEKSIYKVGCWIEAKEGDAVTFTPGRLPVSFQTWQNNEGRKDSQTVWRELIAARVQQENPLPVAVADRERLFRRLMNDIFGIDPAAPEVAAFVADSAPDALPRLIASLQARAEPMHFAGELSGGETKFRVTAAVKKDEPSKPATE